MEFLMAALIGVMFAAGTYMILRPSLIRIAMGFGLYSNAANLLLIACGGFAPDRESPFISDGGTLRLMDPLPPDIILTAIVISFAVSALLLTVAYRVYLDHDSDDPEKLPPDALA
jgi:multicomponent Na+:H+ antiporter subunit C